jgi:DNA recombination protein RmuC
MNELLIILIFLVIAGFAGVFWMFFQKKDKGSDDKSLIMLQNQINEINNSIQDSVQKLIRESSEVKESSKQVFDVADQLKNLEQVLKNQKRRGSLGEAGLELVLSNVLPPDAYKMQYSFKDGSIADAVIFTKEGVIPVDAKFSLDNYIRLVNEKDENEKEKLNKDFVNDLKKRVNETAKYIKPKEGTLPFAFMYIPAEPIYYDLLVNEVGLVKENTRSIIEYAYKDKNVVIVSPTTFSAYLQSVLYGFRAFRIEKSAQQISKNVENLRRHIISYEEYLNKLGDSLGTTVSHYNRAYKELGKIDKDIFRITEKSADTNPQELDKPKKEDFDK